MKSKRAELMFSPLLFQKPPGFQRFHHCVLNINDFKNALCLIYQTLAYAFRIKKVLTYENERKTIWQLP